MRNMSSFRNALRLLGTALPAVALLTFFSCSSDDDNVAPPANDPNIAEVASGDSRFTILVSALDKAGLVSTLSGTDNYTVFAPTNTAFENAGITQATIDGWADAEIDNLRNILLYHVVSGSVASTALTSGTVTTATGADFKDLYVNVGDAVTINGDVTVTEADITASNGIIHVVDRVISLPQSTAEVITANSDYSLLLAALVRAFGQDNLGTTLDGLAPFTLFAPTNQAFNNAGFADEAAIQAAEQGTLQGILTYHVVAGSRVFSSDLQAGAVTTAAMSDFYVSINDDGVFVNGKVGVSATDDLTTDGVIHQVNEVILPPSQNIVEIAAGNSDFDLLVRAIGRVEGLGATLSGNGPFTVFAPTDAAFEAAGFNEAAIDAADPADLESILTYHVIAARVFSTDLTAGNVATVEGTEVSITLDGGPKVDDANIVSTDIMGTNGVIHVIDAVITP